MNKQKRDAIKELLAKYIPNHQKIQELKGLINYLNAQKDTGFIKSVLPDDNVISSRRLDKQENSIISNMSKVDYLQERISTLEEENELIKFLIYSLPEESRKLFIKRYCEGVKIIPITLDNNISETTYYNIINDGLKSIDNLLNHMV